ncbi:hypothetical protein AWJ20_4555 [Sugiyamaella lignohabitans]|uniref:Uncharacterized protein n=1 Tax=Sugiyamaella lignohabitans TaxID=796027 RepID=A0A167CI69_9ASCO|nr:uncharacterized protein AWJ20_4555 [Sugiyamaella lignohabitans]ANB11733.1 hypothetical protein AWJ20_4555 [Sugiyamaella lignohabitans]
MGLVNYSSDSESDDDSQSAKATTSVEIAKSPNESNGISSVLPGLKRPGPSTLNLHPTKKPNTTSSDKKKIFEVPRLPGETNVTTATPATSQSANGNSGLKSIASFLPAPKNRLKDKTKSSSNPDNSDKHDQTQTMASDYSVFKRTSGSRVLGGGIKNTFFDGEISMPSESPDLDIDEVPIKQQPEVTLKGNSLKLIPASVAARNAKYGKKPDVNTGLSSSTPTISSQDSKTKEESKPKSKPILPSLFSFHREEEQHVMTNVASSSEEYKPLMLEQPNETSNGPDPESISNSANSAGSSANVGTTLNQLAEDSGVGLGQINKLESRHGRTKRSEQQIQIVDFNVDEFYQENERLKASGALEDNSKNRVTAISGGKHQLTSLLRSAQKNRDGLEEQFARNKQTKNQAGKQYGFK